MNVLSQPASQYVNEAARTNLGACFLRSIILEDEEAGVDLANCKTLIAELGIWWHNEIDPEKLEKIESCIRMPKKNRLQLTCFSSLSKAKFCATFVAVLRRLRPSPRLAAFLCSTIRV